MFEARSPIPTRALVPEVRRIAILVREMSGGGAQRDAVLLAGAMAARGWHVSILTLKAQGELLKLVAPGVEVVALASTNLRTALPSFRRAFSQLGPRDVVLSSEVAQNVIAFLAHTSLARATRPKLLLREVASPSMAKALDPYLQHRFAYRLAGMAYSRCDRSLTLTQGARTDLINNFGVPAAKIDVLRANAVIDSPTALRLGRANLEAPGFRDR